MKQARPAKVLSENESLCSAIGDILNHHVVNTTTLDTTLHHEDHRHLLVRVPSWQAGRANFDALIVPTSRRMGELEDALLLARELGSGLLVMCSGDMLALEAAAAGARVGVPVIAADVAGMTASLPVSTVAELINDSPFARRSDTSLKRNLALLLARTAGWERVLFLDDDIFDVSPDGARAAAWLTRDYDAVGLRNRGFPDNSVVCHVHRVLNGSQRQFIGAGALAVRPQRSNSHFPNIYNQDWFFMIGHHHLNVAVTGRMSQAAYEPFFDPDRARREELGDCLAEGLYWLLDEGKSIEEADIAHWDDFLSRRSLFIKNLMLEVSESDWVPDRKERVLDSLRCAQRTTAIIEPELCVELLERWRTDVETWRTFVGSHQVLGSVESALSYLGWRGVVVSGHPWPGQAVHGVGKEERLRCQNGRTASDKGTESRRSPDSSAQSSQFAPAPA